MSDQEYLIVAYYKFAPLPDYEERREPLQKVCEDNGVKGTILLAAEGINSTMAGPEEGIEAVLDYLESDPAIGKLTIKRSWAKDEPFYRMKVRLKKEIVRLGMPEINPNEQVGTYVEPEDWNALISDPDVVVVDTRNDYEYEIGTFKGAVDPKTTTFREFPDYVERELSDKKDKKIAMFCTGGIRCEKSTSLLLHKGFKDVYHLNGGILNYLEKVKPEDSLWEGECFVFDNRVTVDHKLEAGAFDMCHACRHTLTDVDKESEHYVEGISCPHCVDTLSDEQRARAAERQKQMELNAERGIRHIGAGKKDIEMRRTEKLAFKKQQRELRAAREAGPE
ncbi:MAG: rhodanese-related sulfurtransferase [Verrucomicrobiota bacterium]